MMGTKRSELIDERLEHTVAARKKSTSLLSVVEATAPQLPTPLAVNALVIMHAYRARTRDAHGRVMHTPTLFAT